MLFKRIFLPLQMKILVFQSSFNKNIFLKFYRSQLHHKQLTENISINKICPIGMSSQGIIKLFVGSNNQTYFHQIHYYIWNINRFSGTFRTNRGKSCFMRHSHRVLYLHPLVVFKNLAQVESHLDMDAYEVDLVWDYSTVLRRCSPSCRTCLLGWHIKGLSTMCTQLTSWQVKITWYPISQSAGRCGLYWVSLSFNPQATVNSLLNLDWSIICLYLQLFILTLFPILTVKTVIKENNALAI